MSFIKSIIQKNGSVSIVKYNGDDLQLNQIQHNEEVCRICFLDVETTGKNKQEDGIIELAMKVVSINKETGNITEISSSYESMNDPGIPITEEASLINGITDDMISGKCIDWETVSKIIESTDLIVSHNASFDRAFIDRVLPLSQDKIWACTITDIDWMARGFNNNKQELLCIWHGFYYDSHRAMTDIDALIHLVTHNEYSDNKPVLELIDNAYKISALNSPYETKDILKSRNYYWNGINKYWWKQIDLEETDSEMEWLKENVYKGPFQGRIEEITLVDKYKD
jgi:DNA polymerase-3 subunit epsilon